MSFDKSQFRSLISETLKAFDLFSDDAVELLMLTAAQESGLGKYLTQVRGPALGVFQAEPATIAYYLDWLGKNRPELKAKLLKQCGEYSVLNMKGNLILQIVFARVHYLTRPGALPPKADVRGMAEYYKKHYNTHLGKATVDEAMTNYRKYCVL